MSNPTGESKDVFTVCKQNVEKFFTEIKKSTPRYQLSEATLKTIRDITEQAIKAYEDQNKIALEVAEETTKAFNVFNESAKSFASLNRNIMESMMSAFQQKSKT